MFPSKQQLENFYRLGKYNYAVSLHPSPTLYDKKLLGEASALAVPQKSLQAYCEREGIL